MGNRHDGFAGVRPRGNRRNYGGLPVGPGRIPEERPAGVLGQAAVRFLPEPGIRVTAALIPASSTTVPAPSLPRGSAAGRHCGGHDDRGGFGARGAGRLRSSHGQQRVELGHAQDQHERFAVRKRTEAEPSVEGLRPLVDGLYDDGAGADDPDGGAGAAAGVDPEGSEPRRRPR